MKFTMENFLVQHQVGNGRVLNSVYTLLPEQSMDELVAAMGVNDEQWAPFTMADFPGCQHWPSSFRLTTAGDQVEFDLASALVDAEVVAKAESAKIQAELTAGYTTEQIAAQTTVPVDSRDAEMQSVIDVLNAETDRLTAQLDAIAAATTVDELNAAMGYTTSPAA